MPTAADVAPVQQVAALKHDTQRDLDMPPVQSFSPVQQVAAQAPTPAATFDNQHDYSAAEDVDYQQPPPPLVSWRDLQLLQAGELEAAGRAREATFLRDLVGRLS